MTGWSLEKANKTQDAFYDFLNNIRIHSKELGGNTILGQHLYEAQHRFIRGTFQGLTEDIHDFKWLKSRQLGISTVTRAFSLFWLGMHPGLRGAMVFDTDANKENARTELTAMIEGLPKRFKFPKLTAKNRYGIQFEHGTTLQFMAAGIKGGRSGGSLGRSSGINFVHASEMCSWSNEEGVKSFQQSLAEDFPDRLFVWESTARGFNLWHKIWTEACKDDLNQRATFLGWWSKDNQKILRDTPAFQRYGIDPPTDEELEKIKLVAQKYNFQISPEQLAWIRRKTDPAREREAGEPDDAYLSGEQAWDEDEAFQATGSTFFNGAKLTEAMGRVTMDSYKGYKYFPGADFPSTDFQLARTKRDTQLKIWEEPSLNAVYVIAGDPAFGRNEKNDRSACQVLRCYADCVEQVAEFASASTPTNQFAWLIWSLAAFYSMGGKNQICIIIEVNGPGEAVWNEGKTLRQIVTTGYQRKAADEKGLRDFFNSLRQYVYASSSSLGGVNHLHWTTTTQLKVTIFERLRDFFSTGVLIPHSMETLEEMRSITRDGDSISAEGKGKDDRVFAVALALRAWEDRFRSALIAGNRTKRAEIVSRQITPEGRYQLFTQSTLDSFFKAKQRARLTQHAQIQRMRWRGK